MLIWLRRIGIVLGALAALIVVAAGVLLLVGDARVNQTYTVTAEPVAIPADAAGLARGRHIAETVCTACHGANLAGGPVLNAPGFAVINAPNLTAGSGGVADEYKTDADWVRAIRHGVDPDTKSLLLMPSADFYYLSDADLGAVIAYVKSVPAVDNEVADKSFSVPARILMGAGALNGLIEAAQIDQTGPRPAAPAAGVTAEYGHYLAQTRVCQNCHGPSLAGGANPDPNGPRVPNITPGGDLGKWKQADFVTALRTGATPDGRTLSDAMPWKVYSGLTDDELAAIWLYLQSLPAQPSK